MSYKRSPAMADQDHDGGRTEGGSKSETSLAADCGAVNQDPHSLRRNFASQGGHALKGVLHE